MRLSILPPSAGVCNAALGPIDCTLGVGGSIPITYIAHPRARAIQGDEERRSIGPVGTIRGTIGESRDEYRRNEQRRRLCQLRLRIFCTGYSSWRMYYTRIGTI